jgi:peptide/nickel transport system permease protein
VAPLLWLRGKNTLLLSSTAMLLAWIVGLPAGFFWAGRRRGGAWDRLFSSATSLLLCLPTVLAALLLLRLALRTGAFPVGGMSSPGLTADPPLGERAGDVLWHLALPALALSFASLGVVLRHVRAAVAEVRGATFVQAARARGLPRSRLRVHYLLLPASHPLLALFGLSVASLLSGSLLVEVVFGWPGLGPLLLDAILSRDVHVVLGAIMASAIALVLGSTAADVLLRLVDPRLSRETEDS